MMHPLTGLKPLPVMRISRGDDECVMTRFDLPRPGVSLTQDTRTLFVKAVQGGLLSREEFLEQYCVTESDFARWKSEFEASNGEWERSLARLLLKNAGKDPPHKPVRVSYKKYPQPPAAVPQPPVVRVGDLILWRDTPQVMLQGRVLKLKKIQRCILMYCMDRAGYLCTKQALRLYVYGDRPSVLSSLNSQVSQLRRIVGPERLHVVYSQGWVLIDPARESF